MGFSTKNSFKIRDPRYPFGTKNHEMREPPEQGSTHYPIGFWPSSSKILWPLLMYVDALRLKESGKVKVLRKIQNLFFSVSKEPHKIIFDRNLFSSLFDIWRQKWRRLEINARIYLKGPFKNNVDKILTFFDYLPTLTWTFFTLNVDKKKQFWPLTHLILSTYFWMTP